MECKSLNSADSFQHYTYHNLKMVKTNDTYNSNTIYDIAIIGGGVVGLTTLRNLTNKGYKCILLEKNDHLLQEASGSNSGIICTGVDAPLGSLERSCIRDSISEIRIYCEMNNIPTRSCGSLVCIRKANVENGDNGEKMLEEVAKESWDAGDTDVRILSKEEVMELEPNLEANDLLGAVHIVGEIVVDPWLLPISYAVHARSKGACIITSFPYDPKTSHFDNDVNIWHINNSTIKARVLVNATGIQADIVQSCTSSNDMVSQQLPLPKWEAKPRRGQYRIFKYDNSSPLLTHPIQPVPTQHTKGIFLFSSIYNHIIVGPTATEQGSRTDRCPDAQTTSSLTSYAKSLLPHLKDESCAVIDDYVGIRPATNHRDYQIHLHPKLNWITASGIRSTGLSASLGIGRYVTNLVSSILPKSTNDVQTSSSSLQAIPPLQNLIDEFHSFENGCVHINGYSYKVTHPITINGWNHSNLFTFSSNVTSHL